MRTRNIVIIVVVVLFVIVMGLMYINRDKSDINDCQEIKTEIVDSLNKNINEYTLENRNDLFFYDSTRSYSNLETKSRIKYSQKNGELTDYITVIYLLDNNEELAKQSIRFSIDNDNNIVDYNQILGARDEIIDSEIKKENYGNIQEDTCDVQQNME